MNRALIFLLLTCWTVSAQWPRHMSMRDPAAFRAGTPSTLNNGLEAHWLLDEASGNRSDSFGANTLTDNFTVTSGAGVRGNAAVFATANTESLSRADNASLSFGDEDVTFAYWVRHDGILSPQYHISKAAASGNYEYLALFNSQSGLIDFYVSGDGTATTLVTATTPIIADATWHLVVLDQNSTDNTIGIRVTVKGGVLGTRYSAAHTTGVFNGTSAFTLGAQTPAGEFSLNGSMDEVRVYRRLLMLWEIAALASDPPPP